MRRLGSSVCVLSMGIVAACNGNAGTGNPMQGNPPGTGAGMKVTPNVVAGLQPGLSGASEPGLGSSSSALRVGSNTVVSLESLKYYIQFIQLCQDLEVQGSGYNNPKNCINLYQNPQIAMGGDTQTGAGGVPVYNDYMVSAAKDDTTPDRFIDLMSAAGQTTLRQAKTVDASAIGSYKYGLINFYRPIKVKATFPILGSTTDYFRTKAVVSVIDNPSMGGFGSQRAQIGDTLSGATEETTYMLNNGGTFFVFQKPFEITQADVDAGTELKVDLVFNPDSFGQAYDVGTFNDCTTNAYAFICDPMNQVVIDMPFVRMSPVPRKTGEKTRKETYLMDYATGTAASKVRIELYYNDADPEKSVQGIDTAVVYDATATSSAGNVIASTYMSQTGNISTNDAVVTLEDYTQAPSIEGLARRKSGQLTVHCVYGGTFCPTVGATLTSSYTYVGDTVVSSD